MPTFTVQSTLSRIVLYKYLRHVSSIGRYYLSPAVFSSTISDMSMRFREPQAGYSALIVPLILSVTLLVAAIGVGAWAFTQMMDYKNNSDQKVTDAVVAAKQDEDKVKDAAFAEQEKSPLKAYTGPAAYGSIAVNYPKTWSGYIIDTRPSSPFVDGYFYPGVVPDIQDPASSFALRVQVIQTSYSETLSAFTSYVQQGKATVHPYALPKVPSVIGVRIDGQLSAAKSGSMIILPLRNMTLKVWTEAPQFQADFSNNILPNLTFAP